MIKEVSKVIWETLILPTIRFIIGYAPMIAGVIAAKKVTIQYFIFSMAQYSIFKEWVGWYIPSILIITIAFIVMASKANKIHPVGMVLMLVIFLITMGFGVSEMRISFFYGDPPTLIDSLLASVSAVASVYCVALMVQRAWADFLPKRKR